MQPPRARPPARSASCGAAYFCLQSLVRPISSQTSLILRHRPSREPLRPGLGRVADGGFFAVAHDRRFQEQRIVEQRLLQKAAVKRRHPEALVAEALRLAVDERIEPHARSDGAELSRREPLLLQIDELDFDGALFEPALGLAGVSALLGAEDLDDASDGHVRYRRSAACFS